MDARELTLTAPSSGEGEDVPPPAAPGTTGARPGRKRRWVIRRLWRREDGSTPFMIVWFLILLVVAGLSIDSANGWRHHQLLKHTSDAAAHAGALALLEGRSDTEVRNRAQQMVADNITFPSYGPVISDPVEDIVLLNYDPVTNTISRSGTPNAVGVRLRRDRSIGNPVDTYILRIAGLASGGATDAMNAWDIRAFGVVAVADIQRCSSTSGIYAQRQIHLTSGNSFGSDYCLHSQDRIWMPQRNSFAPGSRLSMPDLDACGSKCTDAANPGSAAAALEQNLIMPDVAAHIAKTKAAFLSPFSDMKSEFFRGRQLDSNLSVLAALSQPTGGLTTGAVLRLTQSQFMALPRIPKGLTYDVSCTGAGNTSLSFRALNAGSMRDVAIITDCELDFGQGADITASLLVSTRQTNSATITASPGAQIGSPGSTCIPADRTYIMGMGDIRMPARVAGSNVSLMTAGSVHFAAGGPNAAPHVGLTLIAGGEVHVAAQHDFTSCATTRNPLTPSPRVIRHVEPAWRS